MGEVSIIGLDLAKNVFQAHGAGADGAVRQMRTSLRCPYPTYRSDSEKFAPLSESGGAGLLVSVAVLEVALRWKVIVDRGMN